MLKNEYLNLEAPCLGLGTSDTSGKKNIINVNCYLFMQLNLRNL